MKNLFDPKVKEEILARIDQLTPHSKAVWGKMNVNQGLRHMTIAFDIAVGKLQATFPRKVPMPKWLLKIFLLNLKPPKGRAETFTEMNTVSLGINPEDFEAERLQLKLAIESFVKAPELIPQNKLGGKFTRSDWGKLNYNHTDHHLTQFGV